MELLKAVLDTNVVVSAHLNTGGRQSLLLRLGLSRRYQLCVSDAVLEEYEQVLLRPRFGLIAHEIAGSLAALRNAAMVVLPQVSLKVARDPDDDKFLECAVEAKAHFVVTGNLRHFPARFQQIEILSPRAFELVLAEELERRSDRR